MVTIILALTIGLVDLNSGSYFEENWEAILSGEYKSLHKQLLDGFIDKAQYNAIVETYFIASGTEEIGRAHV